MCGVLQLYRINKTYSYLIHITTLAKEVLTHGKHDLQRFTKRQIVDTAYKLREAVN